MTIKRCYPVLVGASVGENQLCNGESVTVPNGRKYYLKKSGTESLGASTGTAITGLTSGSDMVIDLTQMLGSTIADYVYTLEQATAGSGIAWLRSYGFLGGYKAYNTGSIESVEVTGKKVVGFNQWDEELEVGYISSNGGLQSGSGIRSKNYCNCIPNTTYRGTCPSSLTGFMLCWYDGDKNFISRSNAKNITAVSPTNAYYFKVSSASGDPTTYNHDICINLSNPDRNGEYEPYTSQTYALGSDTLRGIFKLDSNNQLYANGDRKSADGFIARKYSIVDLGTLNWNYNSTVKRFVTPDIGSLANKPLSNDRLANIICARYMTDIATHVNGNIYNGIICLANSGNLFVMDNQFTNITSFTTAMSGVMLVYEAATPTTEQSTPFQNPQICDPDGTEEYVTSNGVPVGHETKYQL